MSPALNPLATNARRLWMEVVRLQRVPSHVDIDNSVSTYFGFVHISFSSTSLPSHDLHDGRGYAASELARSVALGLEMQSYLSPDDTELCD
jgi:hypothetical protein